MNKIINYNGETLENKFFENISDEKCKQLKEQYYQKPDFEEVIKNIKSVDKGGKILNKITNYYFKDLMAKVKLYHSKWSIEDVFNCNDLIRSFYAKTLTNKKVFPDNMSDIKKIETALRLGGKGIASKPTNFPIKTVDYILENFNINNNYYDFSCGWGVRMLGALRNRVNYFGTDPNYLLTDRLNTLSKDYKQINNVDTITDIRTQGSEEFIPAWENRMGVAFSSPPYFGLEDYKVGNQSYKNNTTYQEWKDTYLTNTIKNIYRYLINDGTLLININNYKNFDLVEDTKKICEENGFKLVDTLKLDNIKRVKSTQGFNDNSEGIFVFKKII